MTFRRPEFLLPDRFSYLLTPLFHSFRTVVLFEPRSYEYMLRESLYFNRIVCIYIFPSTLIIIRGPRPLPQVQGKQHLYGVLFRQQAEEGPCRHLPTHRDEHRSDVFFGRCLEFKLHLQSGHCIKKSGSKRIMPL